MSPVDRPPSPDPAPGLAPSACEIERLRSMRLDEPTAVRQRRLMRGMIAASVALIVTGQCVAWAKAEAAPAALDAGDLLRALPSGHSLMLLGLLVGMATPFARAVLLARWFAGRGERAMTWISMLLLAILLSGLLLRH